MLSRRRRQQNHGSESPGDFRLPGKPHGRGGLVHCDSGLAAHPGAGQCKEGRESSLRFEEIVQTGLNIIRSLKMVNMAPLFPHLPGEGC